jgi:hypothetical protein
VSAANPTTYVLEAMRAMLIDGWDAGASRRASASWRSSAASAWCGPPRWREGSPRAGDARHAHAGGCPNSPRRRRTGRCGGRRAGGAWARGSSKRRLTRRGPRR